MGKRPTLRHDRDNGVITHINVEEGLVLTSALPTMMGLL